MCYCFMMEGNHKHRDGSWTAHKGGQVFPAAVERPWRILRRQ